MTRLTLTGLRLLVEVVARGSLSEAAEVLGYTQSAVSRQVRACEEAVGLTLFERQARGVRPTPAGEALARHARQVLATVETAELEVAGFRDRLAGRVGLGAYPTAAARLVPQAMARIARTHPGLELELHEAGSPAQLKLLRAGRIEVAVIAGGTGLPDHALADLRTDTIRIGRSLGVAVATDHRLVALRSVHVDDLAAETWIVGSAAPGEESLQFGAWPTLAEPRIGYRATTWSTRLGLVAAGLGVSVLPGLAAETTPYGVRWVPVEDPGLPAERTMVLATASSRSPAVAALVNALHVEAERYRRIDPGS